MFTKELVLEIIENSNDDFTMLMNLLYSEVVKYVGKLTEDYMTCYTELFGETLMNKMVYNKSTNNELSEYIVTELNRLICEIKGV